MEVKKAKREKLKVPIMITGASGSGKTVSALLIAKGIVEKMYPEASEEEQWAKIGVIDTEHKRSLLYTGTTVAGTHIGEFLHIDFEPPFTVANYITAFDLMKNENVEVIIVDSITHAWSGRGGILEEVENKSAGNANKNMLAWKQVKPLEQQFQELLTGNGVYVIATARSKQAYDFEKTDNGKNKIVKMGLKPDQKDSLEYEFAIALRMDQTHFAEATKDNSNLLSGSFPITTEVGHTIQAWSDLGINLEEERRELILSVVGLSEKSSNSKKKFNEMLNVPALRNIAFDDLPNNVLLKMRSALEKVVGESSSSNDAAEGEEASQPELFDASNPPFEEVK